MHNATPKPLERPNELPGRYRIDSGQGGAAHLTTRANLTISTLSPIHKLDRKAKAGSLTWIVNAYRSIETVDKNMLTKRNGN